MATKEITFQNYNVETGEFFTDTKTCTVISSGEEQTFGDTWKDTWYVVEGNVDLGRANIHGSVHLILADGCYCTAVKGKSFTAGLNVQEGDTLTVYGQAGGTGQLTAKGGTYAAGIGGDDREKSGTIIINGGQVTALRMPACSS